MKLSYHAKFASEIGFKLSIRSIGLAVASVARVSGIGGCGLRLTTSIVSGSWKLGPRWGITLSGSGLDRKMTSLDTIDSRPKRSV